MLKYDEDPCTYVFGHMIISLEYISYDFWAKVYLGVFFNEMYWGDIG